MTGSDKNWRWMPFHHPRMWHRYSMARAGIDRLKVRSRGISQHYVIELIADETVKRAIGLCWSKQPDVHSRLTHSGSTVCEPTKPTGIVSVCGALTSCSLIWKPCFVTSNPKMRNYLCELITLYSLAKVSPTYLICSAVCAALTLHRTSDFPSGAAGGRIRFT